MRVKFQPQIGRAFGDSADGSSDMSGAQLVVMTVDRGATDNECVFLLTQIVGRLVDLLPEDDRLTACGLEFELERA